MRSTWIPALIALLALASLGCTTGRPMEELTRALPYASRLELLDAEHRLALARDEVRRAEDAARTAGDALALAERESAAAKDGSSEAKEAEARIAFLRADDAFAKERLRLAKAEASCTELRLERDRLHLLTREEVAGAEELSAAPVEEKLAQCESDAEGLRANVATLEKAARAAEEDWERADAKLALERPAASDAPYLN